MASLSRRQLFGLGAAGAAAVTATALRAGNAGAATRDPADYVVASVTVTTRDASAVQVRFDGRRETVHANDFAENWEFRAGDAITVNRSTLEALPFVDVIDGNAFRTDNDDAGRERTISRAG